MKKFLLTLAALLIGMASVLADKPPLPATREQPDHFREPPLYASDGSTLFRVNPRTGKTTTQTTLTPGLNEVRPQLSYDHNHHFLYAFAEYYDTNGHFYAIDQSNGATYGPYLVTGIPTDQTDHNHFLLRAFTYNPWNNHIYAVGSNALATARVAEIDPWTWTVVANTPFLEGAPGIFSWGTFDPWTGYLLFSSSTTRAITVVDPGTGHVPGSLEKYPIPPLEEYQVVSLAVHPLSADIYFVAAALADPAPRPIHLYRTQRSTGRIYQVSSDPFPNLSIAFGDVPSPRK